MFLSFVQFIKQLPFVRLIFPFILGIILQIFFEYNFNYYSIIAVVVLVLLILTEFNFKDSFSYQYRFISGILLNLLLVVLGSWLVSVNTPKFFKDYNEELVSEAIIMEPPVEKLNSYKTFAEVKRYSTNNNVVISNDKIVIYFEKDISVKNLYYGDKIIFKSRIYKIKNSGNPYEFNYKEFLFRKGICAQTYIKKEDWKKISEDNASFIYSFAYKLRENLADVYKRYGIDNQQFAILQALTLGNKSEIEEETRKAFVASGAMHILAVSGLHVGIIFLMLNFFLKFLDKFKNDRFNYGKYIKAFILIVFLWVFAFVSGLSPSVSRAALMFTFVIFGKTMQSRVNIYNSLAISAFILLLIDPYKITSVGFQLSYSAVIAIVHFQPKIIDLFVIKNKILYYVWSLTAVSIAAQIGTAPISLYYFHIFPNYFILTNILVIPLATAIIYSAAGLLLTSTIPYLSDFFAFALKKLIFALNYSVNNIEALPFSNFENISFNFSDLIFSILVITMISFYFHYKQTKDLLISLFVLLLWLGINTTRKVYKNLNNQVFVYNIKDVSTINFIGEKNILLADNSVLNSDIKKYSFLNNWMHFNKKNYEFIDINTPNYNSQFFTKQRNYFKVNSKTFLIINTEKQVEFLSEKKLFVDYIIISKSPKIKINEILNLYETKILIFDSSNDFYSIEDWKTECEILKQDCFFVIDGAFSRYL